MIGHITHEGLTCPGCHHEFEIAEPYVLIVDGPTQRAIFCFDCAWIIKGGAARA